MKYPKLSPKIIIPRIFVLLILLISTQVFSQNSQNYSIELDSIVKSLHYKEGDKVTVYTQFKVNNNGQVTDIKARGPHQIFEERAIGVAKDLPKYNPSILKEKPVGTKFNLPFVFIIKPKRKSAN
jgi:hypothetical protein